MYLREKGNPRADTIELIYKNLGLPLDELVNNRDMTQNYEFPDFLSLAGHINSIHPVLMPVVYQSFQMAKKIINNRYICLFIH